MKMLSIALLAAALSAASPIPMSLGGGSSTAPLSQVAAAPALLAVLTAGDSATLIFNRGTLTTSAEDADQIASEYGNPPAILHFAWTSGGVAITLDVRQQAGEAADKFMARAAKLKEAAEDAFPVDPPVVNP